MKETTLNDATQALALWAWSFDMDAVEREAMDLAPNDAHYARIAWQPVALWGPHPQRAELRKLRRAAMSRLDARYLSVELGWEALGQSQVENESVRPVIDALSALSEPKRLNLLWLNAKSSWANGAATPFAPLAKANSIIGLPWGSRAWQSASWSAMASMDWASEKDSWMASKALSAIEHQQMESAADFAGSGAETKTKRL